MSEIYKKTILKFTSLLSEFLKDFRSLTRIKAEKIISDIDGLTLRQIDSLTLNEPTEIISQINNILTSNKISTLNPKHKASVDMNSIIILLLSIIETTRKGSNLNDEMIDEMIDGILRILKIPVGLTPEGKHDNRVTVGFTPEGEPVEREIRREGMSYGIYHIFSVLQENPSLVHELQQKRKTRLG